MGMNFSPMYQPVSTKTIKADGDLNINPYDLLATDVKCDTVEADEFVGGVGNFTKVSGAVYVPWAATTTSTNIQLMPEQSHAFPQYTSGWNTALTFNTSIPTTQPAFGINLDRNISTFYANITCSNLYGGNQMRYQLRVNGIDYPIHEGPGNINWNTFTENNVLFNIGDNVVEFYANEGKNKTYTISIPAMYITSATA